MCFFKDIDFEIYLAILIRKQYLQETLQFIGRRQVLINLQSRKISSIFLAFQTISLLIVEGHGC